MLPEENPKQDVPRMYAPSKLVKEVRVLALDVINPYSILLKDIFNVLVYLGQEARGCRTTMRFPLPFWSSSMERRRRHRRESSRQSL